MSRYSTPITTPSKSDMVEALRESATALDEVRELTTDAKAIALIDVAVPRVRDLLASYDHAIAEHQRLSKLCRICEKEPRRGGFDHCCGPNCIPF